MVALSTVSDGFKDHRGCSPHSTGGGGGSKQGEYIVLDSSLGSPGFIRRQREVAPVGHCGARHTSSHGTGPGHSPDLVSEVFRDSRCG